MGSTCASMPPMRYVSWGGTDDDLLGVDLHTWLFKLVSQILRLPHLVGGGALSCLAPVRVLAFVCSNVGVVVFALLTRIMSTAVLVVAEGKVFAKVGGGAA